MAETVLDVSHLTKVFHLPSGDFTAVDDLSFSIHAGEIVGLLGPNGAGKTTTIQLLLGLITATDGSIHYFGKEFMSHREYCLNRISFTSAYAHMQGRMTVAQNLEIFAGLYGILQPGKRIRELVELLGVGASLDQLFWKLSSGQKTRVLIVRALLHRPQLMLMDEPTASLDPEIVNTVLELILDLQKREQVAILYTSHNMREIERICDRVIFLNRGKIVAEDSPLGLSKRVKDATLLVTFDGNQQPVTTYLNEEKYPYHFKRNHLVAISIPEESIPKILFGFSKHKIWVTDIDIQKPDLEDVFLAIAQGAEYEPSQN